MNKEQSGRECAQVYALFASVLANEPDEVVVEGMTQLLKAANIEVPRTLAAGEELTQRFYGRMVVAVSPLYLPAIESCLLDAREENGRLEPGHVDGAPMTEVVACYRTYDFNPRTLNGFGPLVGSLRPDHVVAELAFMAHLCRLEEADGEKGRAAGAFADQFLQHHVRRWVPLLCTYARQRGEEDIYVLLLEALNCWLEASR